jgi:hypothetical protein
MARQGFDYGEKPVTGGKSFKNPAEGKHPARLRSVIHLGIFQEEFKGKLKDPAPYVCAVFELKDDGDFNEDGTPMSYSKTFPLRDGDKSFLTKFLNALDKEEKSTGFDDLIGACCELDLTGSEEKGDDGLPKYINLTNDGISTLHPKLAAITEELSVKGVGHVKFADLTKEAVLELHPIRDVANILLSENHHSYVGSKAEAIIAEIRKEDKDFAVRKASDEKPAAKGKPAANSAPAANEPPSNPPAALAADEEF